jgi:WD40 repeat protein
MSRLYVLPPASPLRRLRRLSPLVAIVVVLALPAAVAAPAGEQAEGGTDVTDGQWLHDHGNAYLVREPRVISGAGRWAIDSPRHRGDIYCMALAPDGKRVATGGVDGVARIWNLENGTLEKAFAGHTYHLHTMAWSPDGKLLATHAWGDLTVKIWNVESGKLEKQFERRYYLHSLRWSPDGKRLAGATLGSGQIYVSDDLGEPRVITEMGQPVGLLGWSPDGTWLAVASPGSPVTVIDASSGTAVYSLEQAAGELTSSLQFSPDGSLLATGGGKIVGLWNAADGTERRKIATDCAGLCWSPDSGQLATVAATGLTVWNVADGTPAWKEAIAGGHVGWSAETDGLVIVGRNRLFLRPGKAGGELRSIDAGGGTAPLFQAGRPVITGIGTPVLSAWDPNTLKRIQRIEGHGGVATAAAWSRDGKQFASADSAGVVRIWDTNAWTPLHALETAKRPVPLLDWSPDGRLLAAAGGDATVRLWTAAGEPAATLEGHANVIRALAWAPGSQQLVSGAADGEVIVWDVRKGTADRSFTSPVAVIALAWSTVRGAPALAAGGSEGSIRIWNPASGEMLGIVVDGQRGGSLTTQALGWLPGNQPLILSTRTHLTQVWDPATSRTVRRQLSPGGGTAVFPTAGGSLIVNRCGDRTVRFWEPAKGTLRGTLLEEGDSLVAVTTTGDVKFDPDVPPGLIAIVETPTGQQTITLDEFAAKHGWKNQGKMMRLPAKN